MVKSTKVNYYNLHVTGKTFGENSDALMEIIKNMRELDERLKTVWQGEDADIFSDKNYLLIDSILRETNYLKKWGSYFSRCSSKYGDTVMDNTSLIRKTNNNFLEEEENDIEYEQESFY